MKNYFLWYVPILWRIENHSLHRKQSYLYPLFHLTLFCLCSLFWFNHIDLTILFDVTILYFPETLKYWVGVQRGQSYLMVRRCLFSLGGPPFWWYCHNKNNFWGRCFITSTSLAPHLFLLGWLNLNPILLLDQLRLA